MNNKEIRSLHEMTATEDAFSCKNIVAGQGERGRGERSSILFPPSQFTSHDDNASLKRLFEGLDRTQRASFIQWDFLHVLVLLLFPLARRVTRRLPDPVAVWLASLGFLTVCLVVPLFLASTLIISLATSGFILKCLDVAWRTSMAKEHESPFTWTSLPSTPF